MWNKKYLKYKAKYQALKLKMTGGCACGMPGCENGSKCGGPTSCVCDAGSCKCTGVRHSILATFVSNSFSFKPNTESRKFSSIDELQECSDFSSLKSVVIRGIREIPARAFKDCANLEEVTIENPINRICQEAFMNCKKLRKVFIKPLVVAFESNVFLNAGLVEGSQDELEIYASDQIFSLLAPQYPGMSYMHEDKNFSDTDLTKNGYKCKDSNGMKYLECPNNVYINKEGIMYTKAIVNGKPVWYVRYKVQFDDDSTSE